MARRRGITIALSILAAVVLVFIASIVLVLVNVSRGPAIADESTLVLVTTVVSGLDYVITWSIKAMQAARQRRAESVPQ